MTVAYPISAIYSQQVVALVVGTLGFIAVVSLILLLILREQSLGRVESGIGGRKLGAFARNVLIPIVPLSLLFAVFMVVELGLT